MKTQMEKAFECMVNVFHEYSILNPSDDFLQEKEFQKLMKEQARPFLRNTMPPNLDEKAYILRIFQKADKDKNGKLKFTEFMVAMGAVLIEAHERSHRLEGMESGHGHGHSHSHGCGPGHNDGHGHGHAPGHSDGHGHGHAPGHSDGHGHGHGPV